ncbi:MAG: ferritin-like domain-containing protein [Actinobacteria bacterium]|nr:ferritin-like domain-containing protein [Actinomycetota bacterium]
MTTTAGTSRRTVLALGAAAIPLLAACTSETGSLPETVDPVRRESLGDELRLIALYEAALAQSSELEDVLTPIVEAHRAHAEALRQGLAEPSPTPPAAPTIGADPLEQLRTAEREAVGLRSGACTRTTDPDLASLLCLISASEAQHVAVLAGTT